MADRLDRLIKKHLEQLDGDIEQYARRLSRVVAGNLDRAAVAANSLEAQEALEAMRQFETVLLSGGLDAFEQSLAEMYGKELSRLQEQSEIFADARFEYSDGDLEIVEQLIEFDFTRVTQTLQQYVADARVIMGRQVLLGEEITVEDFRDINDARIERNIATELQTSMNGFANTMKVKQAVDIGLQHFRYAGPDPDQVTRPFCLHLQGQPTGEFAMPSRQSRVYTIDEIRTMNNGQSLDVFAFGGGWNCRHSWNGITPARAREVYGFPN